MRRLPLPLLALAILSALAACSGGTVRRGEADARSDAKTTGEGPCAQRPPATACGQSCAGAAAACPAGFHCGGDGRCTAECFSAGAGCRADQRCNATGSCEARPTGRDGGDTCADLDVRVSAQTPTVIVVVDKSGSMNADFGGDPVAAAESSRWDAVRQTLLDAARGVLPPLMRRARFGLALYTASNGGEEQGVPAVGTCPMLELAAPALGSLDALRATYLPESWRWVGRDNVQVVPPDADGFVGEDTPTGDAIDGVIAWLQRSGQLPSPTAEPVALLLATDGEPDRCEDGDPGDDAAANQAARQEAVAAVTSAYATHGVKTFVLFVGALGNATIRQHMTDLARAGHGRDAFYEATDAAALRSALQAIVSGQVSCTLALAGRIPDLQQACLGSVLLEGRPLQCGSEWRAADASHVELLGDACTAFKSGKPVTARFPCDAIIIY